MEPQMVCRFFNGLFGPDPASVPVFGDRQSLMFLAQALDAGLRISDTRSSTGLSESEHAMTTVVGRLQKAGKAPLELEKMSGLSDDQRIALGFEPTTLASGSLQDMGVPPFKNLDMAVFLARLRFVARYQGLLTGIKPVFQVGVLTLSVQGIGKQFFAQTLVAEQGEVTNTVWLYRWVVSSSNGQYDEHWRPFDGPIGAAVQPAMITSQGRSGLPNATDGNDITTTSNPALEPALPQHESKKIRSARFKPWEHFEHAYLSDDELFASPSHLIQGDTILRLAHSYSNQAIFDRINANKPEGTGVKSVNVVTKRLTHAIQAEAEKSGRSVSDIRAQIAQAKSNQGVKHKGKVDARGYGGKDNPEKMEF